MLFPLVYAWVRNPQFPQKQRRGERPDHLAAIKSETPFAPTLPQVVGIGLTPQQARALTQYLDGTGEESKSKSYNNTYKHGQDPEKTKGSRDGICWGWPCPLCHAEWPGSAAADPTNPA